MRFKVSNVSSLTVSDPVSLSLSWFAACIWSHLEEITHDPNVTQGWFDPSGSLRKAVTFWTGVHSSSPSIKLMLYWERGLGANQTAARTTLLAFHPETCGYCWLGANPRSCVRRWLYKRLSVQRWKNKTFFIKHLTKGKQEKKNPPFFFFKMSRWSLVVFFFFSLFGRSQTKTSPLIGLTFKTDYMALEDEDRIRTTALVPSNKEGQRSEAGLFP